MPDVVDGETPSPPYAGDAGEDPDTGRAVRSPDTGVHDAEIPDEEVPDEEAGEAAEDTTEKADETARDVKYRFEEDPDVLDTDELAKTVEVGQDERIVKCQAPGPTYDREGQKVKAGRHKVDAVNTG